MKYFLFLNVLLFPVLVFGQTPTLYDTWRTSAPLHNPVIKISPDKLEITDEKRYNSFPSDLLPRAEDLAPAYVIRVPKVKVIDILKVTYDSGTAKGRIFFQRGKYSGIACLKFHIFDNGSAVIGSGHMKDNGSFRTLREADSVSRLDSLGYEFPLLNNTVRIAMFATMLAPELMSEAEAVNMISSFEKRAMKIIRDYFASSPSERKRFMYSFDKIPAEIAIGEKLISDLFIEYGYNPLRLPEAVSKFRRNAKVREALDHCDKDLVKLLKPFTDPPEKERPKPIVKLAPDLVPPDGQVGRRGPPPMPVGEDEGGNSAPPPSIPTDMQNTDPDPAPDEYIAVTEEAKPLHDLGATVEYPELARRNNIEGKVVFMALINRLGWAEKVIILNSDNKIFDQAVIDIVKKTVFSPAKRNKIPVKTWYTGTVKFKL